MRHYPFMKRSSEEAMIFFDSLSQVDLHFMLGEWSGSEFPTDHPLDGLLTAAGWKGKNIVAPEIVHPLLFEDFSVNPDLIPLSLSLLKIVPRMSVLSQIIKLLRPILSTEKPQARLEMRKYRNKYTCAIVYSGQPITDYFAKIDDMTLLGVMEYKNWPPYFFKLTRKKYASDCAN